MKSNVLRAEKLEIAASCTEARAAGAGRSRAAAQVCRSSMVPAMIWVALVSSLLWMGPWTWAGRRLASPQRGRVGVLRRVELLLSGDGAVRGAALSLNGKVSVARIATGRSGVHAWDLQPCRFPPVVWKGGDRDGRRVEVCQHDRRTVRVVFRGFRKAPVFRSSGGELVFLLGDGGVAGGGASSEPRRREPVVGDGGLPPRKVVIDAGHGGRDPGAVGWRGLLEKDVVLDLALALEKALRLRRPGLKVVLTRRTDTYVPLSARVRTAREAGADLFVSLHANASGDGKASGVEIYTLSRKGATDLAARVVQRRENDVFRSELESLSAGGLLGRILLDMQQTATLNDSSRLAGCMAAALRCARGRKELRLHFRGVRHADFYVLRPIDVPCVLVETGFITTPHDARLLGSPSWRRRMAGVLADGIVSFLRILDMRRGIYDGGGTFEYIVKRGDTLSSIARRYSVPVEMLTRLNRLASPDRLRAGTRILVPRDTVGAVLSGMHGD